MSAANGWSIHIGAARAVLNDVETLTVDFDTASEGIVNTVARASGIATGETGKALLDLAIDPLTADAVTAKAHVVNAIVQTRAAILSYDAHDYQMALDTEKQMESPE